MNRKPKRRLFDILTKEVSIVDDAANERKFLVIKNKEVKNVEEIKGVLENIEKALNTLGKGQKALIEAVAGQEPDDELKLEKAGAKYSQMSLTQLRSVRAAVNALLEGQDEDDKDKDKTDTKKKAFDGFLKSFQKALGINEEKKPEIDENAKKALGEVLMKLIEEAGKEKGKEGK